MKKFKLLIALLIGVLAVAMAGCGEDTEKNLPNKDELEVGVITHLNASEEKYNEFMKGLEQSYRPSKENKTMNSHYYNNLNEMQMALKSNLMLDMQGMVMAKLAGAMVNVQGSGMVNIKGAMVCAGAILKIG